MFRLGAVGADGGWASVPLGKELWSNGCLGIEPRRVGIALADILCDWGEGGILAECLHALSRRAVSLLNYTLAFASIGMQFKNAHPFHKNN
jgi:hypothetical protein